SIHSYDAVYATGIYRSLCDDSYKAYKQLLMLGVGREQARGILVPSVYTTWVWTASLQSILHFLGLRDKPDAQGEIVEYARCVRVLISPYVPETISAYEALELL
ncbi:MAG: FAD-dependent thymidylate synthase, partial [Waterburya sp.]